MQSVHVDVHLDEKTKIECYLSHGGGASITLNGPVLPCVIFPHSPAQLVVLAAEIKKLAEDWNHDISRRASVAYHAEREQAAYRLALDEEAGDHRLALHDDGLDRGVG